jgi:hypothetical protein
MTKTGRRRTKPSTGFVPLRDLVPRNDPKGGSAGKTVFGERPPVLETEDKHPFKDVPAERRQKPGHDRNRRGGETT